MRSTSPYRLTLFVCLAEIFGLASIAVFPALLPTFMTEWRLSHTEAGWISAAYYAGYMILVPVLAGITDRMDARNGPGVLVGADPAIYSGYQPGRYLHARAKGSQRSHGRNAPVTVHLVLHR
jgi:MFS family permease